MASYFYSTVIERSMSTVTLIQYIYLNKKTYCSLTTERI